MKTNTSAASSVKRAQKFLIIEDNCDLADMLSELLLKMGYETAVAYNGGDGIAKADQFLPEIVLCDIGLPDMDGFEVAKQLKTKSAFADTYLVAMTCYDGIRPKNGPSFFDYITTKPIDRLTVKMILGSL